MALRELKVVVKKDEYEVEFDTHRKSVRIFVKEGSVLTVAGNGKWNGFHIYDCSAELGEEVYDELDQAIFEAQDA